jgi:secreted PhoX family phosphatase
LVDPATFATSSVKRNDKVGSIFAIVEQNPATPASSTSFGFYQAWHGTEGKGVFDAANPDNIVIDAAGGVWFGTDGNYGRNQHSDAIYYLDLDFAHASTPEVTFGKAFRIVAVASDAEATGPSLTPDGRTLFVAVQHPGEAVFSAFPQGNALGRPLPTLVAVTLR